MALCKPIAWSRCCTSGEWPPACIVSIMLANHETGVLQPIQQLAAISAAAGVPLHTDAVAAAGKIPVRFRELGMAALSVAAHKFQGPPGIGALIIRHDSPLAPQLFGGHQQEGSDRARSRSPWPSACKRPWSYGKPSRTSMVAG